nr:ABC transporter substrate-binding protein [uncultured Gellertiella sp.]
MKSGDEFNVSGPDNGALNAVGVSRRGFMQLAMAAGVTMATAQAMFISQAKAAGKKGGVFKAALSNGAATDSLDPTTWGSNYYTSEFGSILGNNLTSVDARNAIVPQMAESFKASDGAKTWTFKLRKGVKFQNGKTVTPEDVIASFDLHRGKDSKSGSKAGLEIIDTIKAVGDDTVVFTLKTGAADFAYETASYRVIIVPAKDGKADWSAGGTGPFKIKSFEPGVKLVVEKNPDYYDADNIFFDGLELLVVADAAARTNALLTGEVHYIDRVDLKTIELLKANSDVEIDNVTGFSHLVATMNTTVAPFDNPDVRRALKYAFDRDELLAKVGFGYGTVGNDNPFAPTLKYAIENKEKHSFNPEKAREYLKKAGLDSLKIDLSTSTAAFDGAVDAAQLMKESAAKCGIEINIINEPADSYWDAVWMKKPFMLSYWGGRPTIDQHATQAYAADAAWNDTFWKNPRFNELLVAARAETDETKRAAMYAEMQEILQDDGGQIVLMFNNYVSAHTKAVVHGELNSNLDHDGTYMWRRWSFA